MSEEAGGDSDGQQEQGGEVGRSALLHCQCFAGYVEQGPAVLADEPGAEGDQ